MRRLTTTVDASEEALYRLVISPALDELGAGHFDLARSVPNEYQFVVCARSWWGRGRLVSVYLRLGSRVEVESPSGLVAREVIDAIAARAAALTPEERTMQPLEDPPWLRPQPPREDSSGYLFGDAPSYGGGFDYGSTPGPPVPGNMSGMRIPMGLWGGYGEPKARPRFGAKKKREEEEPPGWM